MRMRRGKAADVRSAPKLVAEALATAREAGCTGMRLLRADLFELRRRTGAFVAPVEVAPHCAGAALDLTLVDRDGTEWDMGGAVNAHRAGDERSCPMDAEGLSDVARRNRGIMARALSGAGFVNMPTEWWHWAYGDRYWALLTDHRDALYGPV